MKYFAYFYENRAQQTFADFMFFMSQALSWPLNPENPQKKNKLTWLQNLLGVRTSNFDQSVSEGLSVGIKWKASDDVRKKTLKKGQKLAKKYCRHLNHSFPGFSRLLYHYFHNLLLWKAILPMMDVLWILFQTNVTFCPESHFPAVSSVNLGKWSSELRICILNWKVHGSNPIRCSTGLKDPTLFQGSQWD